MRFSGFLLREGAQIANIFGAEPSHRGAGSVRAGHAVSAARPEARGLGGAHGFPVAVSKPGVAEPGFGGGDLDRTSGADGFPDGRRSRDSRSRTARDARTAGAVRIRGRRGAKNSCAVSAARTGLSDKLPRMKKEGSAIGRTPLFVRTVRERFRICDSRRVEKARCPPSLFGRDGSVGVLRFRCGRDEREPAVRDAGACNAAKHTVARGLLGASEADRCRTKGHGAVALRGSRRIVHARIACGACSGDLPIRLISPAVFAEFHPLDCCLRSRSSGLR